MAQNPFILPTNELIYCNIPVIDLLAHEKYLQASFLIIIDKVDFSIFIYLIY